MNPPTEPSAEAHGLRFRFDPTSDWLFNDLDVEFPRPLRLRGHRAIRIRQVDSAEPLRSLVVTHRRADRNRWSPDGDNVGLLQVNAAGNPHRFLFQDALLDPTRTVLDNITEGALFAGLSPRRVRARARDQLREVGLDTDLLSRRLPATISGGQAQRVALCRALIKQPTIVLADEPTGISMLRVPAS